MGMSLAALVLALSGAAIAATSGSPGTITACVHRHGGALYIARKCARHDQRLAWGITGPTGATGPRGVPGSQGVQGPQGVPGPASGSAGGALTGSYPDPVIAAGAVTSVDFAPGAVAPDSTELGGAPASDFGAVLTGRMNSLSTAGNTAQYGAVTGISTASSGELGAYTLAPDHPLMARDLSVLLTASPNGAQRDIVLMVNGAATSLRCSITNGTTCTADGPVAVPAGSTLSMATITGSIGPPSADALFAFRLTQS